MFSFLKRRLLAWRVKRLISLATETLYAERFDMSPLVASISGGKDGIDLVRAYVAISIAARLTVPLSKSDVDDAIEQLHATERHLNAPDFDTILQLYKELAELRWAARQLEILEGKLAQKNDEFSSDGIMYAMRNAKRGPITAADEAWANEMAKKRSDLQQELEQVQLKQLQESGDAWADLYREALADHVEAIESKMRFVQTQMQRLLAEPDVTGEVDRLEERLKRALQQKPAERQKVSGRIASQ
jgi:hypothetical protein